MRTLLNYLASVYHEDSVGTSYSLKPVSNHYNRLVVCKLSDSFHKLLLVLRVNVCRSFIENNNRRVLHYGSCNGDSLSFTAGECCAALAYHSVKSVGKSHDEVVAACFFCGGFNYIHRSIQLSETDVVRDGVGEEVRPLEHE